MVKKFFLLLCFITLPSKFAWSDDHASILLLGDSLSASYGLKENQGWVYRLNQVSLQQKKPFNIINASISGETTGGGLARLPRLIEDNNADILLIELGGNDGLRGFPPHLIKNNLLQIIKLAQEKKITVWVMQIQIPPNYGPRYNQMFEDVFKDVTSNDDISLLPFFMTDIAIKPEFMMNDGIHPNLKAQEKISNIMLKTISEALN